MNVRGKCLLNLDKILSFTSLVPSIRNDLCIKTVFETKLERNWHLQRHRVRRLIRDR